MKRRMQIKMLAPLILILAACHNDPFSIKPEVPGLKQASQTFTVKDPAEGERVRMSTGDDLVVQFKSNPTTGYYWVIVAHDPDMLPLEHQEYHPAPAPKGMVGTGGVQAFTFRTESVGNSILSFSYQRSENDVATSKSISIEVTR